MRNALWLAGALSLIAFVPVAKAAESGLAIERTPERVARGEYLLTGVMECVVTVNVTDPRMRTRRGQAGDLPGG
jgi:hypothetical protein